MDIPLVLSASNAEACYTTVGEDGGRLGEDDSESRELEHSEKKLVKEY